MKATSRTAIFFTLDCQKSLLYKQACLILSHAADFSLIIISNVHYLKNLTSCQDMMRHTEGLTNIKPGDIGSWMTSHWAT